MLGFVTDTEMIGLMLPTCKTLVMATKIPLESGIAMVNVYSTTLWLLYIGSVVVFLIWHHTTDKKEVWIYKWIDNNESLTVGIFTTAVTVGVIEGSARLANCIVWTYHTLQNNSSNNDELKEGDIFPIVWMPQILCGTIVLIGCHCIECCIASCKCTHEVDLYIHIVLPVCLIGFGLVYSLFPAIILILAYPIQAIVTLTFILAYLFATTSNVVNNAVSNVLSNLTSQLRSQKHVKKTYKQHYKSSNEDIKKPQLCRTTLLCFIELIIPFSIVALYLNLIATVFLYSLLGLSN